MSNTKENTVLAFERTSEKPNSWLKCRVIGDDGKERTPMLTEPTVIEIVSKAGVGVYEFTSEKDGKYWKVTNAKFLRPLPGASNGAVQQNPGNPGQSYAPRNPGQTDPNTTLQNRSITSQVALKVAGEVMGHALTSGAFKIKDGIDVGALSEAVNILAGMLMDTAGKFINPKFEEKKDGAYKDEDGRTHEPIAPEGA